MAVCLFINSQIEHLPSKATSFCFYFRLKDVED